MLHDTLRRDTSILKPLHRINSDIIENETLSSSIVVHLGGLTRAGAGGDPLSVALCQAICVHAGYPLSEPLNMVCVHRGFRLSHSEREPFPTSVS